MAKDNELGELDYDLMQTVDIRTGSKYAQAACAMDTANKLADLNARVAALEAALAAQGKEEGR